MEYFLIFQSQELSSGFFLFIDLCDWSKRFFLVFYRDIFPLFNDPHLLDDTISLMEKHLNNFGSKVEAIVGLESRGFLMGPILALKHGVPFIPIRKAGKLPGEVKSISYQLEYGSDKFEIQTKSIRKGLNCVVVDDLLATGGSLKTATNLIQQCGGNVLGSIVIIELVDLKGRQQLDSDVLSLVQY